MSSDKNTGRNGNEPAGLEQAYRRLEHLYEISKLLASSESVEQTFEPALGIVVRTLPLRSAILIEAADGSPKMVVWPSEGQSSEEMRAVKEHVEAAYTSLVEDASTGSLDLRKPAGVTAPPQLEGTQGYPPKRFIVMPLVVAHRPPFGALQLEGVQPLDKADLIFVNAIGNQFAIALDRFRGRQPEITWRENGKGGRTHAEARRATAERERGIAESLSVQYEALAGENSRLYEQAQQAVREREHILAIVSHDLKNPLSTILMTAGVLAQPGGDQGLPKAVGRIQRAAQRMLRLIEDLLDFASIEAGRLAIKRQPQDPGSMIQETLANFETVAQEDRLRLTAKVEPHLPKVDCDRDRILQVLSNLVGNATKAAVEGGHITLRAETRRNELLFVVSDDGPGIGEEDLKHLFERYWRSGEVNYAGTGLGLAIARGIVSAHGGRIWAESELGRGATFLFTVPVTDDLFAVPAADHVGV